MIDTRRHPWGVGYHFSLQPAREIVQNDKLSQIRHSPEAVSLRESDMVFLRQGLITNVKHCVVEDDHRFEEVEMLNVINLILGGALLLAGRKLFWLFVGAAGFVTGIQLATRFSQGPDWLAILIGLLLGIIFALLAIFLQAIVIWIAGFLAGGYVLTVLATMLGIDVSGATTWIVYIIGGILGVILVSLLFDWALITLSSLVGASLVIQAFLPQGVTGGVLFFIIFIAGVLIQGTLLRRERALAAVNG